MNELKVEHYFAPAHMNRQRATAVGALAMEYFKDGKVEMKGQTIETKAQHGFARTSTHQFVRQNDREIVLELRENEETLAIFPWKFRLIYTFRLENDTLHHTLTVENTDAEDFLFGIGYHPGFTVPFDKAHTIEDYELRFSQMESPMCVGTAPKGLVNGKTYCLGSNIQSIPVTAGMFDNDSHCMVNIASESLGLYEKDTGRAVVCSLKGFPYCLIWSKPGVPQFICIEPWNSLPSPAHGGTDWNEKPAAAILEPGATWDTTLSMSFVR